MRARTRSACLGVLVSMLVALALVGPASAAAAGDDDLPGTPLLASPVSGSLDRTFDTRDVYSVYLEAGQRLTASFTSPMSGQASLTVFEPKGDSVAVGAGVATTFVSGADTVSFTAREAGLHALRVSASPTAGSLEYEVAWLVSPGEANDDVPGEPYVGPVVNGSFGDGDTCDVYAISVGAGERLSVYAESDTGGLGEVALYGPGTYGIGADVPLTQQAGDDHSVRSLSYRASSAGGTYYVTVRSPDQLDHAYRLECTVAAREPDDSVLTPTPLAPEVQGNFNGAGDYDWYWVDLEAGQLFTCTLTAAAPTRAMLWAWMYEERDIPGRYYSVGSASAGGSGSTKLTFVPTASKRYLLRVWGAQRATDYTITTYTPDDDADNHLPGVEVASPVAGSLANGTDDRDIVSIPLQFGDRIVARYTPKSGDLVGRMYLLKPAALGFGQSDARQIADGVAELGYTASATGVYSLCTQADSGGGAYEVSWTVSRNADDQIPGIPYAGASGQLAAPADTDDVYRVPLVDGQRLVMGLYTDGDIPYVHIYPPGASSIESPTVLSSWGGQAFTARETGDHYVRVNGDLGSYGYGFYQWTVVSDPDDDIPGVPLPTSPAAGTLSPPTDAEDVFAVDLEAGEYLAWSTGSAGNATATLYGPDAATVFEASPMPSSSHGETSTAIAEESGVYYLRVSGYSDYSLAWDKGPATDPDTFPGVRLPASPVVGHTSPVDDAHDYYRIELKAGQTLDVAASGKGVDQRTIALKGVLTTAPDVTSDVSYATETEAGARLAFTAPTDMACTLVVSAGALAADYRLDWSIADQRPAADDAPPGAPLLPGCNVGHLEATTTAQIDVWSLPLAKGETVKLNLRPSTWSSQLTFSLRAPGGGSLSSRQTVATADNWTPTLVYTAPAAGTYVVQVTSFTYPRGTQVTYALDADTEPASARPDVPGVPLSPAFASGSVSPLLALTDDVCAVELSAGETFVGQMAAPGFDVAVFAPETPSVYSASPSMVWTDAGRIIYTARTSGTHYLWIRAPLGGGGDWSLSWNRWGGDGDDVVPGKSATSPTVGALDVDYDKRDIVAIQLNKGMDFSASLTRASGLGATVRLFGPDVTDLSGATPVAVGSASSPSQLSAALPADGMYYLVLDAQSGSGTYSLSWSAKTPPAPPAAPEVLGQSPAGGSRFSAVRAVEVAVKGGAVPLSVGFEYSTDMGVSWKPLGLAQMTAANQSYTLWRTSWSTSSLPDGTYLVQPKITDALGRSVTGAPVAYVTDNTAPGVPTRVAAAPSKTAVSLQWGRPADDDVASYRVYKRTGADGPAVYLGAVTQTTCVDYNVDPGSNYAYAVECMDSAGNIGARSDWLAVSTLADDIGPTADAGPEQSAFVAASIVFDGSGSRDDVGIRTYDWDFGDGSSGSGRAVSHAYAEPGEYPVRLTVTDRGGNQASDTTTMTVTEIDPEAAVPVVVNVRGQNGAALAGADVAIEDGTGLKQVGTADGRGQATFYAKPGGCTVYAYSDGYLPNLITGTVRAGYGLTTNVTLARGDILMHEVTITRMTPEQMVSAGIDIHNPENFNTMTYSISWGPQTFTGVAGSGGGFGFGTASGGGTDETSRRDDSSVRHGLEVVDGRPTYAYVVVAGQTEWLKEFFNVSVTLKNVATDSAFKMVDATATLVAPDGISLAPKVTDPQQDWSVDIGEIGAGQTETVSWQVRGDREGDYQLAVDVRTTLKPFDRLIERHFEAPEKTHVYGKSSVTMSVQAPTKVHEGDTFQVRLDIRNMSPIDIYLMKTRLTEISGAWLVDGDPVQSWERVQPDEIVHAVWTFEARATGTLSIVQNEGDISGWIRKSGINGSEDVEPFLQSPVEKSTVEYGGQSWRYFRVMGNNRPDSSLERQGVWFMEATATVEVAAEDGTRESREVTATVDNDWPAGVFGLGLESLGDVGDNTKVSITTFVADGHELDISRVGSYEITVLPRSGRERSWRTSDKSSLGARIYGLGLTGKWGSDTEYHIADDQSITIDLDHSNSVEIGYELPLGPSVSFKAPGIEGDIGARVGASIEQGLIYGTSSRYPLSGQTLSERRSAAFHLYTAMMITKYGGLAQLVDPIVTAQGKQLGIEGSRADYVTRSMVGSFVTGKASANLGTVDVKPSIAGFEAPEIDGAPLGLSLNLGEISGSYGLETQFVSYPKADEIAVRVVDAREGSAEFMHLKGLIPFTPNGKIDEGFEQKVGGEITIDAIFDKDVVRVLLPSEEVAFSHLKRIVVEQDDPVGNYRTRITLDKKTIATLLSRELGGDPTARSAIVYSLAHSLVRKDLARLSPSQVNGAAVAYEHGSGLAETSATVEVVTGPEPHYVDFWFKAEVGGLNKIIGGKEIKQAATSKMVQSRGLTRDGRYYLTEYHNDSPPPVRLFDFQDAFDTLLTEAFSGAGASGGGIRSVAGTSAALSGSFVRFSDRSKVDASPATAFEVGLDPTDVSLSEEMTVTTIPIESVVQSIAPDGRRLYAGLSVVGDMYNVYTRSELSKPATVTARWADGDQTGLDSSVDVRVWRFDGQKGGWTKLGSSPSDGPLIRQASTLELGTFAVGADVDGPEINVHGPKSEGVSGDLAPLVAFSATDGASGIASETAFAAIDGIPVSVSYETSSALWIGASAPLAPGDHELTLRLADNQGNIAEASSAFSLDLESPDVPQDVTIEQHAEGARLSWRSSEQSSSHFKIERRRSGETTKTVVADVSAREWTDALVPGGLEYEYFVTAVDAAGNRSPSTPPARFTMVRPSVVAMGVEKSGEDRLTISACARGALGLPLVEVDLRIDGRTGAGEWQTVGTVSQADSTSTVTVDVPEGTTDYRVTYEGSPAYTPSSAQATFVVDHVPPVTRCDLKPSAAWSSTDVVVALTPEDVGGSGLRSTRYALTGAETHAEAEYESPITVRAEGTTVVEYWSVDAAGNEEAHGMQVVRIDKSAPTTGCDAVSDYVGSASIGLTGRDSGGSGLAATTFRVDGGAWTTGTRVDVRSLGAHILDYHSRDVAGNSERHSTARFSVWTDTALAITVPSLPVAHGAAYAVQARLSAVSTGATLGGVSVVFERLNAAGGWDVLGVAPTAANGVATFVVPGADSGHVVRARLSDQLPLRASQSVPQPVSVEVSLGTPVAPKTMKKNKSYTVYGSLKPRHTSGTKPVRIYKYKKVSGKWKSYGYTTAKASNHSSYSRYRASIKLTSKGSWRLRAYAPADSKHAATWSSKYDSVTVK